MKNRRLFAVFVALIVMVLTVYYLQNALANAGNQLFDPVLLNDYTDTFTQNTLYKKPIGRSATLSATSLYSTYLPFTSGPYVDMIYIPAGEFQMGCDPSGYCDSDETPMHTVYLDGYYIDKFEVTITDYAQCLKADQCDLPEQMDYDDFYNNPYIAYYPVSNVSWYNAMDYCRWVGKCLPSEAEWEKAARGSTDIRIYPWGNTAPDCSLVNYAFDFTWDYMLTHGDYSLCVGATKPVLFYPTGASPYGVMNMAGNVAEWINDWYLGDYYSFSPSNNPPGPKTGYFKVTRGGAFNSIWRNARVTDRFNGYLSDRGYDNLGFRCAANFSGSNAGRSCPIKLTVGPGPVSGLTATIDGTVTSTCSTITRLNWAWGDGQSDDQWFPANHTYAFSGTYPITVTAYNNLSNQESLVTIAYVDSVKTEVVFIPAGEFQMGLPSSPHAVYLDAYTIDKYEVTNAQYAQCVAAGACTLREPWVGEYSYSMPTRANHPVLSVDWYRAENYCKWAGKRLPTEAEWEKAAVGSIDTRWYPWGDEAADCSQLNFRNCINNTLPFDTTPVGSYPAGASPYGVMDMSGNVPEWVNDWYQVDYYIFSPYYNPPGPETGEYKVLKGGGAYMMSYYGGSNAAACVSPRCRYYFNPWVSQADPYPFVSPLHLNSPAVPGYSYPWGFRCAGSALGD